MDFCSPDLHGSVRPSARQVFEVDQTLVGRIIGKKARPSSTVERLGVGKPIGLATGPTGLWYFVVFERFVAHVWCIFAGLTSSLRRPKKRGVHLFYREGKGNEKKM